MVAFDPDEAPDPPPPPSTLMNPASPRKPSTLMNPAPSTRPRYALTTGEALKIVNARERTLLGRDRVLVYFKLVQVSE